MPCTVWMCKSTNESYVQITLELWELVGPNFGEILYSYHHANYFNTNHSNCPKDVSIFCNTKEWTFKAPLIKNSYTECTYTRTVLTMVHYGSSVNRRPRHISNSRLKRQIHLFLEDLSKSLFIDSKLMFYEF